MKIGDKALRVGTSVFLCILVSKLLRLTYPFFVSLPAITSVSSSPMETLKAGRNRMLGTLIGALTGILFAFLKPGSSVLCGIGMIAIIYLCTFIKWGNSAAIAGLVFISIMMGTKGESPLNYSINRLNDTLIGVFITILVNNVIFHKDFIGIIDHNCNKLFKHILSSLKNMLSFHTKIDLDDFTSHLQYIKEQLNIYEEEYSIKKDKKIKIARLSDTVSTLVLICDHLKIICLMDTHCIISDSNYSKLKSLYGLDFNTEDNSYNDIDLIYNYHLEKILDNIFLLKNAL